MFEKDDVTVHLYWPCICGSTEMIIREFWCRVELDMEITEPLYSHTNDRYSLTNPVAEHTNVTLSCTLAVTLLWSMVIVGGDTKKYKILVHSFLLISSKFS